MTITTRTSLGLLLRGADTASSFDAVLSTPDVDSYGESVAQEWDLTRYRANPVVLFGHDHRSLPIGRCDDVAVRDGMLTGKIRIVDQDVLERVRQGVLRAVSVGFIGGDTQLATVDGAEVQVIGSATSPNMLYEVSVVTVPANAAAGMQVRSFEEARSFLNRIDIDLVSQARQRRASTPTSLAELVSRRGRFGGAA